jgi:hypothetical protein
MGKSSTAKPVPPPGFQRGHPRVGGRPKGIVQQIREVTNDGADIIRVVSEIMNDPKAGKGDRLKAAEFLKNSGFGKAPDIALTGELSDSEHASATASLADTELEALARALHAPPSTNKPANPLKALDKPTD